MSIPMSELIQVLATFVNLKKIKLKAATCVLCSICTTKLIQYIVAKLIHVLRRYWQPTLEQSST